MTAVAVALAAAGGIIAALCLGLASQAGVAAAALADILACAAIALAVASYTTRWPARRHLTGSTRPGTRPSPRERGTRSWEHDTLPDTDWQRWEHEVFGWPAPQASTPQHPDSRPLPPPPGPFKPDDGTAAAGGRDE
jgi:hypothetical protein